MRLHECFASMAVAMKNLEPMPLHCRCCLMLFRACLHRHDTAPPSRDIIASSMAVAMKSLESMPWRGFDCAVGRHRCFCIPSLSTALGGGLRTCDKDHNRYKLMQVVADKRSLRPASTSTNNVPGSGQSLDYFSRNLALCVYMSASRRWL